MDYSRRAMLGAMGGLAVGGSLAAMSGTVIAAPATPAMSGGKNGHFAQMGGEFGWTPKKIDDIAYIRFASVYRQFRDIDSLNEEVSKLISEKKG